MQTHSQGGTYDGTKVARAFGLLLIIESFVAVLEFLTPHLRLNFYRRRTQGVNMGLSRANDLRFEMTCLFSAHLLA